MLKATQNISGKYAYDMLILCVKIFKIKIYSVEFKSKKVLLRVSYHIETSQLICKPNQSTGFYIMPVFTE